MTATVGAYLRIEVDREGEVRAAVDAVDGVEAFDVEGDGKLGALIEAEDLDHAHELLVGSVKQIPGVLAAWPVYAHFGDDDFGDGDFGDGGADPPVGLPFADPPDP